MLRFFTSTQAQPRRPSSANVATPASRVKAGMPTVPKRTMMSDEEFNTVMKRLEFLKKHPAAEIKIPTASVNIRAENYKEMERISDDDVYYDPNDDLDDDLDDDLIESKFQAIMDDLKSQELNLADEIQNVYRLLDTKIAGLIRKNNNKKILILMGEQYNNKKSLIVDLVAIRLAKKYNINNFAIELNQADLKTIQQRQVGDHAGNCVNLLPAINQNNMLMSPIDNRDNNKFEDPDYKVKMREIKMINNLLLLNQNTLFEVGVSHLKALANSKKLNEAFNILPINLSNFNEKELVLLEDTSSWMQERVEYFSDPNKALQVHLLTPGINSVSIQKLFEIVDSTLEQIEKDEIECALYNAASLRFPR